MLVVEYKYFYRLSYDCGIHCVLIKEPKQNEKGLSYNEYPKGDVFVSKNKINQIQEVSWYECHIIASSESEARSIYKDSLKKHLEYNIRKHLGFALDCEAKMEKMLKW